MVTEAIVFLYSNCNKNIKKKNTKVESDCFCIVFYAVIYYCKYE